MRVLRVVAVAAAIVAFCAPTVATHADDANAECTNNNDVTIVIDFNELGGGVNVRCAPQPVNSGFDAFRRTNIAVDDYRGFVCRIAGAPTEGPCDRYPPSNYYWVYWLAPRGGAWCYSQVGAGNRTPPPGSIEGWSFFKKTSAKPNSTAPRYPVPGVIPGTTPNQLNGGDCATSAKATTTTTPTPPRSGPSPTSPSPTTTATASTPAPNGGSGTTVRSGSATTTQPVAPGETTTTALAFGLPGVGTSTSSIPLGDVDLTIRRHGAKGSPLGFVVGAGAIGTLAAAAYVVRRRRT